MELSKKELEALERNIPRLPIYTPAYQGYYSAGDESETLCPNCEESLDEWDWDCKQFKFCPVCGQRLMRLDEYEEKKLAAKEESINNSCDGWF